MAGSINCGFAQVAVYTALQKLSLPDRSLPPDTNAKLIQEYSRQFQGYRHMLPQQGKERYFAAKSRLLKTCFARRWNPSERKEEFLKTFSASAWRDLALEKKQQHTLKDCEACHSNYGMQIASFPTRSRALKRKNPVSEVVETQVKRIKASHDKTPKSTQKQLGEAIVATLNPLCQEAVGVPLSKVLESTPKSNVQKRLSPEERKGKRRKTARTIKQRMEEHFKERDYQLVHGHRLSYAKYNKIRLAESFETRDQAKHRSKSREAKGSQKVHGCAKEKIPFNGEQLLQEAKTWEPDVKINWSELGTKVGLTCANRGQVVKEYLASHGIPAAQKKRPVIRRAKRKLPGGEISYPTHTTVSAVRKTLTEKIQAGDVNPGEQIAPREYLVFRFERKSRKIVENKVTLYGRKIALNDIRKKLLAKHHNMGILRCLGDVDDLTDDQLKAQIHKVGVDLPSNATRETLVETLESNTTKRFLKVWHDHGKIAGQGHFLVLVSCIYDPVFYFTSEEMAEKGTPMDVPAIVEEPEIYLLSRSGSSDVEQALYNQDRFVDVQTLGISIATPDGTPIQDVLRFFHGDRPAAEFEAGQNRSGYYTCPTCPAHCSRYDDLTYCFRCPSVNFSKRQEFLLAGSTWENGLKPFDHLLVQQLRDELNMRGIDTTGKTKPEMESQLQDLRKGIKSFPALLQPCPESSLTSILIDEYEVSPIEPLHDFKGHMSNLFVELPKHVNTTVATEIEKVRLMVLNKDTLRCVDYRKAAILLSKALHETCEDESITQIVDTMVEICEIMYADPQKRCPRSVLRLHNLTYVHGRLCVEKMHSPKSLSKRKLFGEYYHALTCHAAVVNRLVALRSLNAELQERVFGQANSISKSTSNYHPDHVLTNIIIRCQVESEVGREDQVLSQNSAVADLASSLPPFPNTFLPLSWLENSPTQLQAHLERISDFLLPGPGIWWKSVPGGIEFLDGNCEVGSRSNGPPLHLFRTSSITKQVEYLRMCWQQCLEQGVEIPLRYIRQYDGCGDLANVSESDQDLSTSHQPENESPESEEMPEEVTEDTIVLGFQEVTTLADQRANEPTTSNGSTKSHPQVKTSLARVLLDIVDEAQVPLIRRFDNLRYMAKGTKQQTTHKQYNACSNFVKTKVLEVHRKAKMRTQEWEKDFILRHDRLPSLCDHPRDIRTLIHQKNIAEKVLTHEWKVSDF